MRRTKQIVLGLVGLLTLAGMFLIVQSQPKRGGFVDRVPFLAKLEPNREEVYLMLRQYPGKRPHSGKSYATMFTVDEKFPKVLQILEPELRSLGVVLGSPGHGTQIFTVRMTSDESQGVLISLRSEAGGKTSISIVESLKPNLFDQASLWAEKFRTGSKRQETFLKHRIRG